MNKLSKHFSRDEFACKCGCGFSTVDAELLTVLESVRAYFDKPVTITSGCRCAEHNKKEGGADKSKHLEGIAADVKVEGIPPKSVFNLLNGQNKYGIGLYSGWVHIDVRSERARWDSSGDVKW